MRKLLIPLGSVLVVAIVVALLLPFFVDINRYHDSIQAEMEKQLGRRVTLGALHLTVLPPALRVKDVVIGEDAGFSTGQPFAQAQELRVAVRLRPLLRRRIELKSVELVQPRIELVRNERGIWNCASLGQAPTAPSAHPQTAYEPSGQAPVALPPAAPAESEPQEFVLHNVVLTEGTLAVTDLQKRAPRSVYEHIDIVVEGYAPGKSFFVELAAKLPGEGAQRIELRGDVGPIQPNDYLHTAFRGEFKLDEVTISGVRRFLAVQALADVDGVASGNADVTNEKGRLSSAGEITLKKGRVRGNDVGYAIAVKYAFTDDLSIDRLEIAKGDLRLGSTPISVSGTLNLRDTPATADLHIKTAEVSIAEAARLAALFEFGLTTNMKIEGHAQSDLRLQGPLSPHPILNGTLKGRELVIGGGELKQPVTIPEVSLALSPTEVRSNSFRATVAGSSLTTQFALTRYGQPDAKLDLTVSVHDVDFAEALNLARTYRVSAVRNYSGSGRFDVDLHLAGPLQGGAFTYSGNLVGRNLEVSGGELKQPLQIPSLALTFSPQEVRSSSFQVTVGGSAMSGQFTLAQYTTPAATIDLTLKSQNAELGEVLSAARVYGVPAAEGITGSGRLSLDLHAIGPLHSSAPFSYSGNGRIMGASVTLPALSKPVHITNAEIQFMRDSAVLSNLSAGVGQTNLTGSLAMRNFTAPQVKFALTADKVIVNEWQQMLVTGEPKRAAADRSWGLLPRAYAATAPTESILMRATGNGTLIAGTIAYDQLVLNNVRSEVSLEHGVIRLSPLTADVYGGRETGSIVVDTHPNPFTYAVNLKMQKVDANQLLSSVSKLKQTIYGSLTGNTNTTFSSISAEDIARSLNGTANVNLTDGKISNMDILYELAQQAKFLGLKHDKKPFTNLVKLSGDFDIHNGVASTQNLVAIIDEGKFAASGKASLVDQTINMHVVAVLSKEFSSQVGGTQVGGYLTTALSNSKGELVIPVIVTGTFSQPHYAPDVEAIAKMKLDQLVPTLGSPGMLSGVLTSIMGQKQAQPTPGKPVPGKKTPGTKDALLQLFNSLAGDQQQQPPQQPSKQPPEQQDEPLSLSF